MTEERLKELIASLPPDARTEVLLAFRDLRQRVDAMCADANAAIEALQRLARR